MTVGIVSASVSAGISVAKSVSQKKSVEDTIKDAGSAAIDGFADGFMTGVGLSSSVGNLDGLKIRMTNNPNYGNITIGYGGDSGKTILSFSNNTGKSLFRIDADPTHLIHMHFKGYFYGRKHHREKLTEIIFGIIVGGNDEINN